MQRMAREKVQLPCKFFLTDSGCRKGKECSFSHEARDDKRRCYTCGSVEHFASSCPRRPQKDGQKAKAMREDEGAMGDQQLRPEEQREAETATMKVLLEEANKMLKSLTQTEPSEVQERVQQRGEVRKNQTLEALQRQINELKQKAIKLSRLSQDHSMGLVDSGATHPLRPLRSGESLGEMREVVVSLASGEKTRLYMTTGGCMVTDQESVEPIIPMGVLVEQGCTNSLARQLDGDQPPYEGKPSC